MEEWFIECIRVVVLDLGGVRRMDSYTDLSLTYIYLLVDKISFGEFRCTSAGYIRVTESDQYGSCCVTASIDIDQSGLASGMAW